MSATVKLTQHLYVNVGGEIKEIGSRSTPEELTIDGECFETVVQVTNESGDNYNRQVVWQNGDAGIDDFDVLIVESDIDALVELAIDRAGTPEYFLHQVEGGVPLILTSDDMLASAGTDGSAETMDQIDQIAVKNDNDGSSTSSTATIRVILLT